MSCAFVCNIYTYGNSDNSVAKLPLRHSLCRPGTDIGRTFATFAANIRCERQSDGCERPPIRLFLLTDGVLFARSPANGVSFVRFNYRTASYSCTLIGEWPPVRKQSYRSLRCSEDLFGEQGGVRQ